MAESELASLDTTRSNQADRPDDLSYPGPGRERSLPVYHEDSGEYVSEPAAEDSAVEHEAFPERPQGRGGLKGVHAARKHAVDDAKGTGKISSESGDAASERGNKAPIEHAKKKDIKKYLANSTFSCAAPHDAEALSEFAYAPTDKGCILSVAKPFSRTNFERMKGLLRRRVKPSRYAHSVSVAETAEKMANAYDVDPKVARMAGLLHDWDKALSPKRLRDRVAAYDLDIDGPTQINMPHLLHGPTAAAVLADEFPEFGDEVFQAIARHTVGGTGMSALDMIVFCSDKLEPGNDVEVYRELYRRIGKMDLRDLFMEVQREGFMYLLRSGRPLNVDAVEVWNYYCDEKAREAEQA